VAGGALVTAALPRPALAAGSALMATDLSAGLILIAGAGANVVVASSPEGLLLVDGGSAERSRDLLALVAERAGGRRVDVLFNTNWRPERTGSNEELGKSGTKIMAHENTKLWLGGDFIVEWQEQRRYRPQPAAALPTNTFYTSGSLDVAGRRVEYRYLPRASTDGDVAVFFPEANVLAVSDLLAVGRYPVLDYSTGGWVGGLEAATKALLAATDANTRIVPAAGAVCGRAQLESQLTLCGTVKQRVAEAFRTGMSRADFVATRPTREFDAERGDPALFLAQLYKGAWAHLRELGGVI
jgi:glyoxylase-like metal-dependent hydrolase (beta-lactamase superfamily II)